jgi:hypothetical protein
VGMGPALLKSFGVYGAKHVRSAPPSVCHGCFICSEGWCALCSIQ